MGGQNARISKHSAAGKVGGRISDGMLWQLIGWGQYEWPGCKVGWLVRRLALATRVGALPLGYRLILP